MDVDGLKGLSILIGRIRTKTLFSRPTLVSFIYPLPEAFILNILFFGPRSMGIIPSPYSSKLLFTLAVVIFVSALPVLGSSGDRLPSFRICLEDCTRSCTPYPNSITTANPFLWLTRWTCEDECKYECMNDVVQNEGVQQFYGKWPFRRFLGMQEPASVFFSIANGFMHFRGVRSLSRRIPKSNRLRSWYLAWGYAGLNTWVWSSVFHSRDKPWTEKMDYFSAGFGITFSLLLAIVRIWHLYLPPSHSNHTLSANRNSSAGNRTGVNFDSSRRPRFNPWALGWTILLGTMFACHVSYLTVHIPFDYGYNIASNVIIGSTHNILWMLWSLFPSLSIFPPPYLSTPSLSFSSSLGLNSDSNLYREERKKRPSHMAQPALIGLLFTLAMSFELFDFPPVLNRTFDAHSLWHAATIGIVGLWYRFLNADARWAGRIEGRG